MLPYVHQVGDLMAALRIDGSRRFDDPVPPPCYWSPDAAVMPALPGGLPRSAPRNVSETQAASVGARPGVGAAAIPEAGWNDAR